MYIIIRMSSIVVLRGFSEGLPQQPAKKMAEKMIVKVSLMVPDGCSLTKIPWQAADPHVVTDPIGLQGLLRHSSEHVQHLAPVRAAQQLGHSHVVGGHLGAQWQHVEIGWANHGKDMERTWKGHEKDMERT